VYPTWPEKEHEAGHSIGKKQFKKIIGKITNGKPSKLVASGAVI
jgi:hypothetical protein